MASFLQTSISRYFKTCHLLDVMLTSAGAYGIFGTSLQQLVLKPPSQAIVHKLEEAILFCENSFEDQKSVNLLLAKVEKYKINRRAVRCRGNNGESVQTVRARPKDRFLRG